MSVTSPLLGFVCCLTLFLGCIIVTLCGKCFILAFRKPIVTKPPAPPKSKRKKGKRTNQPIRTIQIDPDEIDKIYVGKMK